MTDNNTGRNEHDRASAALARSLGYPAGYFAERRAFLEDANEWRRLFAEWLGTFFLVLVAAGAPMVAARLPDHALSPGTQAALPGFVVTVVILSMGAVSGAHLNPVVTLAFTLRRDFLWRRVPGYVLAQLVGAVTAVALLAGLVGQQGVAGATLPGPGIGTAAALGFEAVLTLGLVTVILGTSSGAQNVGPLNAIGVGAYIALAGAWAAPVTGASMNPARSLGPQLLFGEWHLWWLYEVAPLAGAVVAVAFAFVLRGAGGGFYGRRAAQGALGLAVGARPRQLRAAHDARSRTSARRTLRQSPRRQPEVSSAPVRLEVTRIVRAPGTWLTASPRSWRTASSTRLSPWM